MTVNKRYQHSNNWKLTMLVCMSSIGIAFLSHYIGLPVLMLISVGIMCVGIMFLPIDQKLPILFCSLPWLQVLKLDISQPTLYHLLYFVFFLVLLKDIKKVNMKLILLVLLLIIYVFTVRLFMQSELEVGFIAYVISLLFMVLLFPNIIKYYNPILCANMFAFGLLTAFIAERIYRNIPSMYEYLTTATYASYSSAIRYGGLSNDPNFLSMQVLMYLCLVLSVIEMKNVNTKKKFILFLSSLIITVFAFFSVSKMLFLGLILITGYYILRNIIKIKLGTILTYSVIVVILVFAASSLGVFDSLFYRLSEATNIYSLTTGRTAIVQVYQKLLLNNPSIMLFGIGMNDRLYYLGVSTHNTFITGIYQLGVVGFLFIYIPMILVYVRSATLSIRKFNVKKNYMSVFVLGLSMMALDLLMYEGLPILILITITCTVNQFSIDERRDSFA